MGGKHIINGYQITQGRTCLTGVIKDILFFQGEEISEEMLLGLCSGWLFRYGYKKYNEDIYYKEMVNRNDILIIRDGIFDFDLLHDIILRYTGFQVVRKKCSVSKCLEEICLSIDLEKIPIFPLISQELDYFPDVLKSRNGHYVSLYGYDLENRQIYLGDSMIPTATASHYSGTVSFDSFEKALDSSTNDKQEDIVEYWLIEKKTDIKDDISEVILESLKRMIIQNKEEKISFFGQGDVYSGVKAIQKFASDICNIINHFEGEELKTKCEQAFGGIMSPGGVVSSRHQIADYFKMIGKNAELQDILVLCEYIEKHWKLVGNLLIRYSVSGSTMQTKKISDLLADISNKEQEWLLCLEEKIY